MFPLFRDDSNVQLPSQFLSQPSFDDSVSCTSDGVTRFLAKKSAEMNKSAKLATDDAEITNNDANNALPHKKAQSSIEKDATPPDLVDDNDAKSTDTDMDGKHGISDMNPEERDELSPSQSLLSDVKASLKSRKNKRFEPATGTGKRKRKSLPETSKPARSVAFMRKGRRFK